jgi:O-antigen/teichoic acid export membrane protein
MGVGLAFMVLQIAYAVAFSADPLIVAQIIGPAAVADYSVVFRLFSIPAGLAVIAMIPLWPAYREAISRSDIRWVQLTLRRSLLIVLAITVPLAICLMLAGPAVVALWTQGSLTPVYGLYIGFAALTISYAVANVFSIFLNGAQALRFQICIWVPMALLNVVVSVYLASRIGVAGVAFGSVIAVVAILIIPAALYVPRLLRRLEQSSSSSPRSAAPDA